MLPKAMRVRQGLHDGAAIEMIEQSGGVLVRAKPQASAGPTAREVLERIWARNAYTGPPLSDADIEAAILADVARKFTLR